jgi:hypothetical protein
VPMHVVDLLLLWVGGGVVDDDCLVADILFVHICSFRLMFFVTTCCCCCVQTCQAFVL